MSDFLWRDATKPLSSLWIGTSPELELALYTICHLARPNGNCDFTIAGGSNTTVTTYGWENGPLVSTAYPRCGKDLCVVRYFNSLTSFWRCSVRTD